MDKENLAAIDLGTNSCRLRITDAKGNMLYREAVTIKLGEGLYESGSFSDAAIQRGIDCLVHFAELMKDYHVGHYRAVATASCRKAQNSASFIQMVKELSGISLEVISAEEEALLNLKGAVLNVLDTAKYVLLYDLGGGSTEIILAENGKEPKEIYTLSVPWGARTASEAFDLVEYDEDKAKKLETEIKKHVEEFLVNSEFLIYLPQCFCVATSSTPLRLLSMINKTGSYNKDFADGMSAPIAQIDKQIDEILQMDLEQLMKSPYIGENRAPIFVAACIIFRTVYRVLQIKTLTASLKGAQEAIIDELEQKWQN